MHVNVCTMCMSMYVINTICEDIMGSRAPTNYHQLWGSMGLWNLLCLFIDRLNPHMAPPVWEGLGHCVIHFGQE
jgi:hypothetical protein